MYFHGLNLQHFHHIFSGSYFLTWLIGSGAEFALIPSRDEPFGLVAVEFGRKGALGIGGISFMQHPLIF